MNARYRIYCLLIVATIILLPTVAGSYGVLFGASVVFAVLFALMQMLLVTIAAGVDRTARWLIHAWTRGAHMALRLPLPRR